MTTKRLWVVREADGCCFVRSLHKRGPKKHSIGSAVGAWVLSGFIAKLMPRDRKAKRVVI